jgi:hypothetical protein
LTGRLTHSERDAERPRGREQGKTLAGGNLPEARRPGVRRRAPARSLIPIASVARRVRTRVRKTSGLGPVGSCGPRRPGPGWLGPLGPESAGFPAAGRAKDGACSGRMCRDLPGLVERLTVLAPRIGVRRRPHRLPASTAPHLGGGYNSLAVEGPTVPDLRPRVEKNSQLRIVTPDVASKKRFSPRHLR